MSHNKSGIGPESIRELITGFQKARVLLTAYELGVFTAIGEGQKTSADIARAIGADVRATDRILNALCAMNFLVKNNVNFSNSGISQKFLVNGSPQYLSGLMHSVRLWERWSHLTESVRKGGSVSEAVKEWSTEDIESFIAAMNDRARLQAPMIAEMIDLRGITQVLDVGGGSAAFSIEFVRKGKNLRAAVFDLPSVIPITARYIENAGLSGSIDTIAGDYLSDDLGKGYDMVFLSAILHSNSIEQNRVLIGKCRSALNPNGTCVIIDFIMDDSRTAPEMGTLFALNMLVGTKSGDTYTENEIRDWLSVSGFVDIERRKTPFGTDLIIAKRK